MSRCGNCLDGPWSNAACKGYALDAMRSAGLDEETCEEVLYLMESSFDAMTTDEAGEFYYARG